MTQQSKTTKQLIFEARYQSSQRETQRLKQEFASLRADMAKFDDANEKSARSSAQAARALDKDALAAREAAAEYERLARSKRDAGNADGSGERLGRVADFGSRGSAVAGAFAGGTEFANVLGLLDDATSSLAQFGAVGAVSTVAIGAASLAFAELTRQLEEAKERAREYLNEQRDLNAQIAAGATSSDLRGRRDELQATAESAQTTIDQYQGILDRYAAAATEAFANNQNPLDTLTTPVELTALRQAFDAEIAAATDGAITSLDALRGELETFRTENKSVTAQIELYNQALENGATAAADARAAADALEEQYRLIGQQDAARASAALQSSDALASHRDALIAERDSLAASALAARGLATVNNDYDEVATSLERTVERLNAELERNDLAFRQALAREETAALSKEYTDLTAAIAKNKAALQDIRDVSIKAYDDMLAAVAKIEADANEARSKAIADAATAQSEAYLDHLEKLADIEQQYFRSSQSAVARRDAIAFVEAKRARQDALSDEAKSYAKRERELQQSLDKQLQSLQENADKAIRAQRDQYYRESALRVQQYQAILADQLQLQMRLNLVNQIGADNAISAATRYWTEAEKLANAATARILALTTSPTNPVGFGTSTGATPSARNANLTTFVENVTRREINATLRGALRSR